MATHYKIEVEPTDIIWNNCDTTHNIFRATYGGLIYELIDEKNQIESFPDINRFVIVKTKNSNIYRTIFLSEFERKQVMMKWFIEKWCYE